MYNKRIGNIVFYKNNKGEKRGYIFYNDGSSIDMDYDNAIDICYELIKEKKVTSIEELKDIVNNDKIHVMSYEELLRRFDSFIVKKEIHKQEVKNVIDKKFTIVDKSKYKVAPVYASRTKKDASIVKLKPTTYNKIKTQTQKEGEISSPIINNPKAGKKKKSKIIAGIKEGLNKVKNATTVKKVAACVVALAVATGVYSIVNRKSKVGVMYNSNLPQIEDTDLLNKVNNTTPYDRVETVEDITLEETPVVPAVEVVSPKKVTENIANSVDISDNLVVEENSPMDLIGNNDNYYGYTYNQLLEVTNNDVQLHSMINLRNTLYGFNKTFADAYVEPDKDIRAALSFDETVALQQAYNDYSKSDVAAIFNGAEVRADRMSRAYKDASLQLMGAYIIESDEQPVDMSYLLETEQGKLFYERYHTMFLEAKNATGQDKLDKVKRFYDAVRSDFPITSDIRTEGIAHADDYATIEPYKLSVTPMIAAAEMLFQNLDVDYTLDDLEVDFINDIGLCNYADRTFERIETITLSSQEDNTNPLFEQYREAIIDELVLENVYYIDDEHRELTKLDRFQEIVNGRVDYNSFIPPQGFINNPPEQVVETEEEVEVEVEVEEEVHVEEEVVELEVTDEVREQVDQQIEEENEQERRRQEEEAERERQRQQQQEDENRTRVEEEVRQDEEDLNNDLEDANEQIDDNNSDNDTDNDNPVNEEDFGDHNVDFFDDYSDENGNLDDSVENLTTDPTGDQTNEELPDPEETGRRFDEQGETLGDETTVEVKANSSLVQEQTEEEQSQEEQEVLSVESNNYSEDETYEEYEVQYVDEVYDDSYETETTITNNSSVQDDFSNDSDAEEPEFYEYEEEIETKEQPMSDEEIVDQYIESLANQPEEEYYVYSY